MNKTLFILTLLSLGQISGLICAQQLPNRRIALVIGNNNYANDRKLNSPVKDAKDVAEALVRVGFDVTLALNCKKSELERAIQTFTGQLQDDGVAVFYYSGHGAEFNGKNYLIPIDFPETVLQQSFENRAVRLTLILNQMEDSKKRLNIIILDACRKDPYKDFDALNYVKNGLQASMSPPFGTLLAFACDQDKFAKDGASTSENSAYTECLLKNIETQAQPLDKMFKTVRSSLRSKSGGYQKAWELNAIEGDDFCFRTNDRLSITAVLPNTGIYVNGGFAGVLKKTGDKMIISDLIPDTVVDLIAIAGKDTIMKTVTVSAYLMDVEIKKEVKTSTSSDSTSH